MKINQLFIFVFFALLNYGHSLGQNIVLSGDTIEIELEGTYRGDIQWQFSKDSINWTNIKDQTSPTLKDVIHEEGYFRAQVSSCVSNYFSKACYIEVININNEDYKKNLEPIFKLNDLKWCNIPVPKGYRQSQTHPSIIYNREGWNGYNVWLATTPYPSTDAFYENPCIYYSNYENNILNTNFHSISTNPIDKIDIRGSGYNADPDIFLDGTALYCIEKKQLTSDRKYHYMIQSSLNGQEWTTPKELFNSNLTGCEMVSPAIIKYKNKYRIYGAYSDALKENGIFHNLIILESNSLQNPNFKLINKPEFKLKGSIELWHLDLFEYNNILYMVLCGKNTNFSTTFLSTYLAYSVDYTNFHIFPRPLFSDIYSYRPSAFVDNQGKLNLLISTMDAKHKVFSIDGNEIGYTSSSFSKLIQSLNK
ncbi:MAG: hypothetical protein Q8861_02645 [Bacteroidota bacterium]|nr:hypothetical protein [Bacteroidota bacterium]